MASRGQSLSITYVAWDTSANAGKTGDAANHTLRWIKDGTSAAPANSPAEVDAANAPGVYKLALSAGECTCDVGVLAGKSATAGVSIIPVVITFEQLPTAAPAANGGLATVDANNRIAGLQGTKNTLDDLNDLAQSQILSDATPFAGSNVAAIKADTAAILLDTGSDGVVVAAGSKTGFSLTTAEHDNIADAVLARNVAEVEAGAPEHSLATVVLAALESQIVGTTWTIKRTDGGTTHATKTVATDAGAAPITGVS